MLRAHLHARYFRQISGELKPPLQQQKVFPWCLLGHGTTARVAEARLPRALVGRVAVREAGRGRRRGGQQRRVDHVRDRLALRRAQQARNLRPLPRTNSVETGVGASSKGCPCCFAWLAKRSHKHRFTASHFARLSKRATFNSCRTFLPKRPFVFGSKWWLDQQTMFNVVSLACRTSQSAEPRGTASCCARLSRPVTSKPATHMSWVLDRGYIQGCLATCAADTGICLKLRLAHQSSLPSHPHCIYGQLLATSTGTRFDYGRSLRKQSA